MSIFATIIFRRLEHFNPFIFSYIPSHSTCRSVGVQVEEGDFKSQTDESKINKYG